MKILRTLLLLFLLPSTAFAQCASNYAAVAATCAIQLQQLTLDSYTSTTTSSGIQATIQNQTSGGTVTIANESILNAINVAGIYLETGSGWPSTPATISFDLVEALPGAINSPSVTHLRMYVNHP